MNDLFGTLSFFSRQSSLGVSVIKNTNLLGGPILGGAGHIDDTVEFQVTGGENTVKTWCAKNSIGF